MSVGRDLPGSASAAQQANPGPREGGREGDFPVGLSSGQMCLESAEAGISTDPLKCTPAASGQEELN